MQSPNQHDHDRVSKPSQQAAEDEKAAALAELPNLDRENPSAAFKLRKKHGIPQPPKKPKPEKPA